MLLAGSLEGQDSAVRMRCLVVNGETCSVEMDGYAMSFP